MMTDINKEALRLFQTSHLGRYKTETSALQAWNALTHRQRERWVAVAKAALKPPQQRDFDELYTEFEAKLHVRLQEGARTYGDKSFSADPQALAREIEQELLDIAGWGFILWTRLQRLREHI